MAENNTTGAVHLTELSLDLTQFNENIRQIEQATAQVADVSVQNLSKIRDALNIPGEQIKISADTQQFKLDIDEVVNAVNGLSENTQRATSDMGSMFSGLLAIVEKIASEISGSNINIPGISQITEEVNRLRERIVEEGNALSSNSKTVEESSSAYRVLLNDVTSLSQKWGQIGTTIKQSTSSVTADAEQIKRLALQYANFANTIQRSKISEDTGMKALANEVKATEQSLKDLVTDLAKGNVTVEEAGEEYRRLTSRLVELKTQFADTGYEQEKLLQSADLADSLARKYDSLQQKAAKLATAMSKFSVKFDSPELNALIEKAKELGEEAKTAANDLRTLQTASEQDEAAFNKLVQILNKLELGFKQTQQGADSYKKSLKPIQEQAEGVASSLKALEKSATFKSQKSEIVSLRSELEIFIDKLKAGGMSAEEAERELTGLEERYKTLNDSVNTSNTVLGRFAARLGETIKWRIAHSAITLLMQSFGNLTRTIIDTEDAVIQLKRVLGDSNLVDSSMANALYDIAYQYGQTFDAVQEVAVKFAQTGMDWEDTLEATRVTMLGLNTAELEVSSATEGLIAIMAQFNIEASDLETVIDKINITADNFPITSEKIVAALQRAGGTASAFGMSLEETIGVITALGKATGRAGEAIGTALNSLITFSMKDTALNKFSEFLGQDVSDFGVLELWKALSKEINNGNTEIAKMMAQSEEFSNLMDENLASAIGLSEEYNLALKEENELTAEGKSIIGTVGTYRQNYFIALLNNIAEATHAIYGMREAVGYSMRENVVAMEAFSKQWNQLAVSAQQLAIQFAQSGFLDMMKFFVNLGDLLLKITNNVGGLNTVLVITTALLISIKAQQLKTWAVNTANAFFNFSQVVQTFNASLAAGNGALKSFGAAMSSVQITAAGAVGLLGSVITIIGAITTAIEESERKAAEARAESIREGEEATKGIKELLQAYVEYKNASEDVSGGILEANRTREKMLELLGIEIDQDNNIVKLNGELLGSYEELDEIIQQMTEHEYALAKAKAIRELSAAEEDIEKIAPLNYGDIGVDTYLSQGDRYFRTAGGPGLYTEMLEKDKDLLEEIQSILFGKQDKDTISTSIETLSKDLKQIEDDYSHLNLGLDDFFNAIWGYLETLEEKNGVWVTAKNNMDLYTGSLGDAADATEAAMNATNGFAITAKDLEEDIKSISDYISYLNANIDTFQEVYGRLISIIDEYNETGIMTADMLQSLLELEPEYIQLLDINGESISINDEKLQDLIATNDAYLNQLVALKVAEEIDALMKDAQAASTLGLTLQEYALMDATDNLTLKTYSLVTQLYNGEITSEDFKNEIARLGEQAGITAGNIDTLTESVMGLVSGYGALYTSQGGAFPDMQDIINKINSSAGSIRRYYTPPSTSKPKGSGSPPKEEDPFKAQKEALDEMLDAYDHAITLLERKSSRFIETADESIDELLDDYNEELRLVSEKNIDLTKTIFGNIDTNNRQILEWTEANLVKFKDAIMSWDYTADELIGSISTIMGTSAEYDGVEIAFTPILQTSDGPKLLDADTVDKYIWGLIEQMPEGWHDEDLLKLDATGLEIEGQKIKNLIADIGETAIQTGEAMHYVGELGSVNLAKQALEEAQASRRESFANEHEYLNQVVAINKQAMAEIHAMADEYRAADEVKYAEEIRKLQESYIKREADMAKTIADVSDLFDVLEHKMTLMEVANYKIVDPDKQREYAQQTVNILKQKQDELHYRAQMLRAMGYSETSEYIMSLQDQWKQTTTYIRKEYRAA